MSVAKNKKKLSKKQKEHIQSLPNHKIFAERFRYAETMMAAGAGEPETIEAVLIKWPSMRDASNVRSVLIEKIYSSWGEAVRGKGREEARNLLRARYEFGYRRAMERSELAAGVNYLKAIAKLDDLDNAGRALDVTFAGINLNDRSELEKRLKELAGRAPEMTAQLKLPGSVQAAILPEYERQETGQETGQETADDSGAKGTSGSGSDLRDGKASDLHSDSK